MCGVVEEDPKVSRPLMVSEDIGNRSTELAARSKVACVQASIAR